MKADNCDGIFWKPFFQLTSCYDLEKFFVPHFSKAFSVWYTFLFFWSAVFFLMTWVFFFVTWVNILSNMLIIVVMETTRTNHKNFQVVLHWHSYMPQQNDNHLRMIIMLQWHIAVSCDHVIAWDHIITISIKNIINIK